jgi:hypothetical protein
MVREADAAAESASGIPPKFRQRGCGERVSGGALGLDEIHHRLVHGSCAEAAEVGEDERTLVRKLQLRAGLLRPRKREKVATHGRAGDEDRSGCG